MHPAGTHLNHLPLARVLFVAALVTFAAPTMATAQGGKMPDLRGLWKTTYATPSEAGRLVRESSYEITRQDGELLWGFDVWHPIDPATGKPLPDWIRAPIVGSLNPDGTGGVFAKEGAQFAFRLVGTDEMEIEMSSFRKRAGLPPMAFYAILKRGAVVAVSQVKWPDLSGSWGGQCLVAQPGELRPSSVRLDLVKQDGELLWMDDVWSPVGPLTATIDPKNVLRERMLGSLNPAGTGGVLVKESVRVGLKLLAADRMEVEYIRMGGEHEAPTAFYAVLRKGGDEPIPPPVGRGLNLVGTWTGSYRYALPGRPVDAFSSLVITRQEGNAIWADDVWTQPGEKGAAPMRRREQMYGSLSPDHTHGALAKRGGHFTFRVLDADHLEFTFTGISDNPAAFCGIFTRSRPERAQQQDPLSALREGKWIDLTWSFDEQSVYWPTNVPFRHETVFEGMNDQGYYYSSFKFSAEEHGGTHFDAPKHFSKGGNSIEQVPVEQLVGEGVVVDVTAKAAVNRDYQVSKEDFELWEKQNGRIPDGAIVLLNTGSAPYYPDRQKYTGTTLTGNAGVANLHFPGLHPDAAKWLTEKRQIKAVGLDTPSIDFGQSKAFMTHRILFNKNLTAYENLTNLNSLPAKGYWIIALPMKIKGGSGAPLRIVAFLPAP